MWLCTRALICARVCICVAEKLSFFRYYSLSFFFFKDNFPLNLEPILQNYLDRKPEGIAFLPPQHQDYRCRQFLWAFSMGAWKLNLSPMLAFSTSCLPRSFPAVLIYTSRVPPEVKYFHVLICCLSVFFGGLSTVKFYSLLKLKKWDSCCYWVSGTFQSFHTSEGFCGAAGWMNDVISSWRWLVVVRTPALQNDVINHFSF